MILIVNMILIVLSLPWDSISSRVEVSGPIILFGLYYGFITTLPIGPSQIFPMITFLLEGTADGIVAISGSIMGQLIVFLSMYYSPIYAALGKPHAITLLVVPYMFLHCFHTTEKLSNSKSLYPINPLNNPGILGLFMDSLIFQLLNPIILPSPILTRLMNLFLFRYSNNLLFVISSFCGWLGGHVLFIRLARLVSFRIERDSPIGYTILKRYINRTFSILIYYFCLLYLGRTPSPFIISNKEINDDFVYRNQNEFQGLPNEESPWFDQPWPIILFDHRRWNRPLRYIRNSPFTHSGPVKAGVSQYFFDTCLSDGKQRVSFTSLPSMSVLGERIGKYRNLSHTFSSSKDIYYQWICTEERRKNNLGDEFRNRMEALGNGSPVGDVIEKGVKLSKSQGDSFPKMHDPFLNGPSRGIIDKLRSPWILSDSINLDLPDLTKVSTKDSAEGSWNNQIEDRISDHWQELERKNFPLPWEPLPTDTVHSFILINELSENKKFEPISKQLYLLAEQMIRNSDNWEIYTKDLPNIAYLNDRGIHIIDYLEMASNNEEIHAKDSLRDLSEIVSCDRGIYIEVLLGIASCNKETYTRYLLDIPGMIDEKNIMSTSPMRWELILSLPPAEQASLFEHLGQKEWTVLRNLWNNSSTGDSTKIKDIPAFCGKILFNEPFEITEIQKHVPRWSYNLRSGKYDFIPSINDLRPRKIRSITIIDPNGIQRIVRRYSEESDFRRNLVKGSMRAQRRRTIIWKMIQTGAHSPLFLFLGKMEIPTFPKDSFDMPNRVDLKQIVTNLMNKDSESGRTYSGERSKVDRLSIADKLDFSLNQKIRGSILVTQSILRKHIILPSLIITKNIGRMLLFQVPEWDEDWGEWSKEIHIKCTYDGIEFSETEFPDRWLRDGIQIKILFPFRLKPWHESELQFDKGEKLNSSYLTTWGLETEVPFGYPKKMPSFWKPIIKELKGRFIRTVLSGIGRINEPGPQPDNISTKNIGINNQILNKYQLLIGTGPANSANFPPEIQDQSGYGTRTNIEGLDDWTTTTNDQIKQITDEYLVNLGINIDLEKKNNQCSIYIGSKFKKRLVQIRQILVQFRKKSARLILKWPYLMNLFIEVMSRYISLNVIRLIRLNIQFCIRSTRNLVTIYRRIYPFKNDISETNEGKIPNYHSVTKEIRDLQVGPDGGMILMSQAYLFHEIWQIRAMNKSHSKYLLQYQTSYPFIKDNIKEFLDIQRILYSKEPQDLRGNDWKEWLKCCDRYNVSPQIWSGIAPQRWRNEMSKQRIIDNRDFLHSYEENRFIPYEQQQGYPPFLMKLSPGRTQKLNKRCRYNLFSYSYIDFTKDLGLNGLPVRQNEREEILLNSSIIHELELFDTPDNLNITNCQEIPRERYIHDTTNSQGIRGEERDNFSFTNSPIIHKIRTDRSRSNLRLWLFPELVEMNNTYKPELMIIPIKSLLWEERKDIFRSYGKEEDVRSNVRNREEIEQQKEDVRLYVQEREDVRSNVQDQEKFVGSDVQGRERKDNGNNEYDEVELPLEDGKTVGAPIQFRWAESIARELENNINICSLLSGMKDPERIAIPYLRTGDLDLDLMSHLIDRDVSGTVKDGILIIEPFRLSGVLDDLFLMYKIVSISLRFKDRFRGRAGGNLFDGSARRGGILGGGDENISSSLIFEEILLPRRRREFRILNRFNLENNLDENAELYDEKDVQNYEELMERDQHFDTDITQMTRRFLWPSYRLEDLACMNRYWFNTNDGSRSVMLRIRMYP
uniref:Protein TIC 214 n=1 Tax=Macrozamia mountperriensis TaxID=707766 RepID=A0A0A6Z844_9SPER|nr:hypothetical protein [Macrozamia mountperriensis]AFS64334.1 hypothetical protein [Macrozamia mountperriensis]BAR93606.1 hypothetical protein [Macrozamia mountperriensis]